jgi:hypothetical protein
MAVAMFVVGVGVGVGVGVCGVGENPNSSRAKSQQQQQLCAKPTSELAVPTSELAVPTSELAVCIVVLLYFTSPATWVGTAFAKKRLSQQEIGDFGRMIVRPSRNSDAGSIRRSRDSQAE